MNRGRKIITTISTILVGGALMVTTASYMLVAHANRAAQHVLRQINGGFKGQVTLGHLNIEGGKLVLYNVALLDAHGRLLVAAPRLAADINLSNFFKRGHWMALPDDIEIENPNIFATVDELGQFNFASLRTNKPITFDMTLLRNIGAHASINNGRIIFRDMRNQGFLYEIYDMDLEVQANPDEAATFTFSCRPRQDENMPGTVKANGKLFLDHPELSARLNMENWQLKRLADYPLVRRFATCYDGRIDAQLWAQCQKQDWDQFLSGLSYGGTAKLSQGEVRVPQLPMPVRQIRATAKIANGLVNVSDGFANLGGVGAFLEGNVYLPPRPRLDLVASVPKLRTELAQKLLKKKLPVKGSASIEVRAEGTYKHPELSGSIGVDKLTIQGEELSNCQIDWGFKDRLLTIDSLRGKAAGGRFKGQGYAYLDPKDPYMLFSLEAEDANLNKVSPVGGTIGHFDINVLGSLKDPLVYGSSSGYGFSGSAAPLDSVSGHFMGSKDGVLLTQGQANTSYGQVSMPYAYYDLKNADIFAAVDTDGITLPSTYINGVGSLSARVGGTFQVDGSLKDLRSLSLCGYSRHSSVRLNDMLLSDFNGGVGLNDMAFFFPCLSGRGGSGQISLSGWIGLSSSGTRVGYSGNGNISLLGEGVSLGQLASQAKFNIPVDFSAPTDFGVYWNGDGSQKGNWAKLYANTANASSVPFALASELELVGGEVGALLFSDNVQLLPVKVDPKLTVKSSITGQFAAGGTLSDLAMAYCANLGGLPLQYVKDDTIQGLGVGRYRNGRFSLDNSVIRWDYSRKTVASRFADMSTRCGHANPWLGPEFAHELTRVPLPQVDLPDSALISLQGWYDTKQKAYDASLSAIGIDVGWIARQKSEPRLRKLADSFNFAAGFFGAEARVKGKGKKLQIAKGSNFDIPWMLLKRGNDFDGYSGVGSIWSEPSKNSPFGTIHLDPLVLSRRMADPSLPFGKDVSGYDWLTNFRQGWLYLDGIIDGPEISLAMAVDGWDLGSALAFAPSSIKIDDSMCTGLWHSESMNVFLDTSKPLIDSLEIEGDIAMGNGAISYGGLSVPVKDFSASISQHGKELSVDKVVFDTGMQVIYGSGERHARGGWSADLWSRDIPLEYLSSFDSRFSRLHGNGDFAAHITSPNINFSDPTLYLAFEGRDILLNPESNRSQLFALEDEPVPEPTKEDRNKAIFYKQDKTATKPEATPEDKERERKERFKKATEKLITNLSKPVNFSEFVVGRVGHKENGDLYTDSSMGIELQKAQSNLHLIIPDNALRLRAYTTELNTENLRAAYTKGAQQGYNEENLTTLSASGHIDFSLDLKEGAKNWFMGPCGPDFGTDTRPFKVTLDNLTNDIMLSFFGELPKDNYYSISGDLALNGQWYRDCDLSKPDSSLDYMLTINRLHFGSYRDDDENDEWVGIELDDKLRMHYDRQGNLGRLIVHPFHMKSHGLSNADNPNKADDKAKSTERDKAATEAIAEKIGEEIGEITGEANIVLAKGSADLEQEQSSYAKLKVKNMPVAGLTSYITSAAEFGFVDYINLETHGPLNSPDFDVNFQIRDGQLGKIKYSSIEGNANGRAQGENYLIDLGENIDDALRMYLGKQREQDWNANLWGKLPMKVIRQEVAYDGRLVPVWKGVEYEENGEVDFTANITDSQFRSATLLPGVTKTSGDLRGDMRVTGTPSAPNVSGYMKLSDGSITHAMAGDITNMELSANFDRVPAEQLQAEFQERLKVLQQRPGFTLRKRRNTSEDMKMPDISRFTIDKCEMDIGGKTLSALGKADVFGVTPVNAEINISGEDLPVKWGDLFSGIVDVNARIEANQRRLHDSSETEMVMILAGDIDVKSGEANIPMDYVGKSDGGADWKSVPLYYQLMLKLGDDVWVNALDSRVHTTGTLYIMPNGTSFAPQLAGSVDISRGILAVPFYDVRFKLRNGQLTFESNNNPILEDVRAETEIDGYQVNADVYGQYPNINLKLSSYPQLAESDIKELLALGKLSSYNNIINPNANQVTSIGSQNYTATNVNGQGAAMLSRMLASSITNNISKLFMLSDLSFEYGSDKSYSMRIAKALDQNDRYTLMFSTTFNASTHYTTNIFGLEWRAKRNLMIRAAFDERGYFLPWFQGRWDY